ncbi:sulfite exporter TauE/SafE family protein [Profundibacterium mesophilum]|uniref:Probable membrane transporter protein n=1 Tax=Profundibacterium mesophilum KAUST100406-0324 TaxID=1037889 RepID=A0A921NUM3_9RHOB|nr:sulfite exporter TauE/SafE family protein [Profundibacterium mesophilum]KAF0675551.1 Sulfite exporter TauE/SafE domain containing protein [Profundibacterium mesophilum KAUST100406-0324]
MDDTSLWIVVIAITLAAGFVKGAVGFAMPMLMISGLGSVLAPELALAAIILPTLVSNIWQALRGGLGAARAAFVDHWRYIVIVMLFIMGSAQLLTLLPAWLLYLILGVPVTGFAIAQLAGWSPRIPAHARRRAELGIGAFAGFMGGMSGVWGPPTVMYLTALDTPKAQQIRVQGVVYGMGSVMLLAAHLRSGVLNAQTLPLSAGLLVPALAGMALGMAFCDRLDQARFKRLTLVVLVVAGANLIRRGLMG